MSGVKVSELTGDHQPTKLKIAETQIIIMAPEKWEVIMQKNTDLSYANLARLMTIDAVHLLHDEQGPVLMGIITRTIRRMEQTNDYVRLVSISATLPNYQDVAAFGVLMRRKACSILMLQFILVVCNSSLSVLSKRMRSSVTK